MKKRIVFIVTLSFLAVVSLTAFVFNQLTPSLAAEGQQLLDDYINSSYAEGTQTTILYARHREHFTADMGQQLDQFPKPNYRNSPHLYDSNIISPPDGDIQFPFPAQEVWCVTVERSNQPAEYFFLARHDNLYSEFWVLYQSREGLSPADALGCAVP